MKQYLDDRVSRFIINEKRKEFEAADVERIAGPLHASDLSHCLRQTVKTRSGLRPPLTSEMLLRFSAGFAIQEWWLGPEEPSEPIDGVLYSTDDRYKKGIFEFKTTRYGFEKLAKDDAGKYIYLPNEPRINENRVKDQFVPLPEWIIRCGMYCAAYEVPTAHIVVYFITSAEMHNWTLEFTEAELEATRINTACRKLWVEEHLTAGTLPECEGNHFNEAENEECAA